MLSNSLAVMKRQRSELNLPELPLYGRADLLALYDRMEIIPIGEPVVYEKNGQTIEITAYHAGHVAGAVSFELTYQGKSVFFTGDLLFNDLRTFDGAQLPRRPVDLLVMETTRGGAERPAGQQREGEMVFGYSKMFAKPSPVEDRYSFPFLPSEECRKCWSSLTKREKTRPFPPPQYFVPDWGWTWSITSTKFPRISTGYTLNAKFCAASGLNHSPAAYNPANPCP
jgi:hypothetical protein